MVGRVRPKADRARPSVGGSVDGDQEENVDPPTLNQPSRKATASREATPKVFASGRRNLPSSDYGAEAEISNSCSVMF